MVRRVLAELAGCIVAGRNAGSVALHWGPLDEACPSVKPDEDRELEDLADSH
jgi:hypothetical protein